MKCVGCQDTWFIEEKQVLPTHEPAASGIYAVVGAAATSTRYVYRCASCGLTYPEKPKRKRKKA